MTHSCEEVATGILLRYVNRPVMEVVVCVALIACVLAIALLPGLNLPPAAMRMWRTAISILIQLTLLVAIIRSWLPSPAGSLEKLYCEDETHQPSVSRLSVTCALLC